MLSSLNRNSMPVTGYDIQNRSINDMPDLASVLGHINTAGFLFDDEEHSAKKNQTSPDVKSYLQMNTTDDKFPILVRRDGNSNEMHLSASSAALDLALSQSPGPDAHQNGWPSFARHRAGQHSMPMNQIRDAATEAFELEESSGNGVVTPTKNMASNRRSMEVKFSPFGESKRPGLLGSPPHGAANGMPKLQSSYSTNDIPTMKNTNGATASAGFPQKSHAEQHFRNHNASMGRIPPSAVNNRQSRDLTGGDARVEEQKSPFQQIQSVLHASAAPFGPSITSAAVNSSITSSALTSSAIAQYPAPAYYGGYGMAMMGVGMGNMQQPQWNNQMHMYPGGYGSYGQGYQQYPQGRMHDNQSRVMADRRRRPDHGDCESSSPSHFTQLLMLT